jgi:hypothetical protein
LISELFKEELLDSLRDLGISVQQLRKRAGIPTPLAAGV